jgi:hypothetical protein
MGMRGLDGIVGGFLVLAGKCSLVRAISVFLVLVVRVPSGLRTWPIEIELVFFWTILDSRAADFWELDPEIKFFQLSLLAFLQLLQ